MAKRKTSKSRKKTAKGKTALGIDWLITGKSVPKFLRGGAVARKAKKKGLLSKGTVGSLALDRSRKAKKAGKRTTSTSGSNQFGKYKKGRTYYEGRPNRTDKKGRKKGIYRGL